MELIQDIITIARAVLIFLLLATVSGCTISTIEDRRDPLYRVESHVFEFWNSDVVGSSKQAPKENEFSERSQRGSERSGRTPEWLK